MAHQLHIATRCRTVDQFIATFRRYVDGDSIFVSMLALRPTDREISFVLALAEGAPALRGTCSVREAWRTSDNRFRLPGAVLRIRRLTPPSIEVFARMRRGTGARARRSPAPPPPLPPWRPDDFEREEPTSEFVVEAPTRPLTERLVPANPLAKLPDEYFDELLDRTLQEAGARVANRRA